VTFGDFRRDSHPKIPTQLVQDLPKLSPAAAGRRAIVGSLRPVRFFMQLEFEGFDGYEVVAGFDGVATTSDCRPIH
jgi:hypothetical protein